MKKAAILIQKSFSNHFEPRALLTSFKQAGYEATILPIEEVYDLYTNGEVLFGHPKHGDLANFDVIIVREVFGQFKFALNIISYMRRKGKIAIDNNLLEEKMMINKITDAQRLVFEGCPFPKTYHSHTLENYMSLLPRIEKETNYPLVVKHRSSGKGANIYKVNDRLDLENLLTDLNEEKKLGRFYIQEFLEIESDFRILYIGDEVVGVMKRIPKKGEFRANFSLGGTVEPVKLTEEIKLLAEKAAKATNCNFAGVDIVRTKDGKHYLLEVNRTPGFEGFSKAHGINVADLFVKYANKLLGVN